MYILFTDQVLYIIYLITRKVWFSGFMQNNQPGKCERGCPYDIYMQLAEDKSMGATLWEISMPISIHMGWKDAKQK
jgi:hypothetical protein